MGQKIPASYIAFQQTYPDVYATYEQLGAVVHAMGPLDEPTRALIKLALAIGVGAEGAVHSHTRKCLDANLSADAIRQVALLLAQDGHFLVAGPAPYPSAIMP
ncbi:MAG: carboxymuconolactone decarboxylase family protein [Caldilineaceae bacterium]|nr:carboxymuconolactone decarboxylase family protein [Caldilineaceae bacterium]